MADDLEEMKALVDFVRDGGDPLEIALIEEHFEVTHG